MALVLSYVCRNQASFYAGMIELVAFGGFLATMLQQVCFCIMAQWLALRVRGMIFSVSVQE